MMILAVDLATEELAEGTTEPVRIPRRAVSVIGFQFVRAGVVQRIGSGAETLRLLVSHTASGTTAFLIDATFWLLAADQLTYNLPLVTDTPAIRTRLGVGTDCPKQRATLRGLLQWTDQSGNAFETAPFAIELLAGAGEDDDSTSTEGIMKTLNWSNITRLTGGTATDLDAQATAGVLRTGTLAEMVNVTDPLTSALVNDGALTVWQVQAVPADTVTAPGIVKPLDFNADTNCRAFVQVS